MSSSLALFFPFLTLLLAVQASNSGNWEQKVNEEGKNVQSLKIEAPSMTEEDQYGYNMPEQYRCDSCKVVVYHLTEALKRRQPKKRRLQEWEYHEIFDETCAKGFPGYGVSLVNGQNVLSGPALKQRDDLEPGMGAIQMGGETWEKRLGEICRKFVYEKVGEDEVYDHFHSQGEVSMDLCFHETRDCHLGPEPPQKGNKAKKASSAKSPKQAKTKASGEKSPKQAKTKVKAAQQKAPDIDVNTFISKLASKHGVAATEYSNKRSFAKWEQLFLLASQRISDHTEKQEGRVLEV